MSHKVLYLSLHFPPTFISHQSHQKTCHHQKKYYLNIRWRHQISQARNRHRVHALSHRLTIHSTTSPCLPEQVAHLNSGSSEKQNGCHITAIINEEELSQSQFCTLSEYAFRLVHPPPSSPVSPPCLEERKIEVSEPIRLHRNVETTVNLAWHDTICQRIILALMFCKPAVSRWASWATASTTRQRKMQHITITYLVFTKIFIKRSN